MPARHHVLIIIAFWVTTSAWLWQRDIWPRLASHQPPPSIDLADEAHALPIRWTVYQGDRRGGYALTGVHYHEEDDTFSLESTFKFWTRKELTGEPDRLVQSSCRVTRDGDIRAVSALVKANLWVGNVKGHIQGTVDNDRLTPHVEISCGNRSVEADLAPVAIARRGGVLNPLLPVNRLTGLKRGQRWRVPMLDPIAEALLAYVREQPPATKFLEAHVLDSSEELAWQLKRPPVSCLIIDYTGDDTFGRTWVRESDGLVLLQEMTHAGERLSLRRDPQ
jgi:hypothetical protein